MTVASQCSYCLLQCMEFARAVPVKMAASVITREPTWGPTPASVPLVLLVTTVKQVAFYNFTLINGYGLLKVLGVYLFA